MKKKLLSWDKAMEEAAKHPALFSLNHNFIAGLDVDSLKWGEEVDAYRPIMIGGEKPWVYMVGHYSVPDWLFEKDDSENIQDIVLKDGKNIKSEILYDNCYPSAAVVEIRIVEYNEVLYWYKEVDGIVEEFKVLGG